MATFIGLVEEKPKKKAEPKVEIIKEEIPVAEEEPKAEPKKTKKK